VTGVVAQINSKNALINFAYQLFFEATTILTEGVYNLSQIFNPWKMSGILNASNNHIFSFKFFRCNE